MPGVGDDGKEELRGEIVALETALAAAFGEIAVLRAAVEGGCVEAALRAMIRAVVVLPTPRMPESRKAWATRPDANAFFSVRTRASWPISADSRVGR